MRLYFLRHGESTANVEGVFSNRDWKHPLTPEGIAQAHEQAENLAGLEVERIYTSPVQRAVQTARILAEKLSAPLQVADALREWDVGIYEGTSDPVGWELHQRVQEMWFREGQFETRLPGGESYHDIENRFRPFMARLVAEGGETESNLLLVAHGGLYLAMLPLVFENVDYAFAVEQGFPYTGYALAEIRRDSMYCLSWCGVHVEK